MEWSDSERTVKGTSGFQPTNPPVPTNPTSRVSFPIKNSPKSAYFALTSSNRMSVTSFLMSSGSLAKSVTPHSQFSKPIEPVMICWTRPA